MAFNMSARRKANTGVIPGRMLLKVGCALTSPQLSNTDVFGEIANANTIR